MLQSLLTFLIKRCIKKIEGIFLRLSNKKDAVKQIQVIFPKYMLNDLSINKLKDISKTDDLYYKSKRRKFYNFTEYF